MVNELSHVFLKDLLGWPIKLKVEFSIYVILGTKQISIHPYRMDLEEK